ncbi:MAG: DUF4167 domain-containing protein [Parvularculaceae bacterium]
MKRGRNQRRRQGMNINRALDSNGPEVRIRGTANQIYDKYLALARDASSAGDRIKAENYLQHAEHYFRLIRAAQPPQQTQPEAANGGGDQPAVEGGDDRDKKRADRESRHNNVADKAASESVEKDADASVENGEDKDRRRGRRRRPRRATGSEDEAKPAETDSGDADQAKSETEAEAAAS